MISKLLVQPAYFAPIAQYAAILQSKTIEFETQDHFAKQTYRTRCYIYGANGKLLLNIPVNKTKDYKIASTEVEINYDEDWQKNHLKSLQSAYRTSPFYEYYEADLMNIFETKHKYLWELHQKTNAFVLDALQEEKPLSETTEYFKDYADKTDIRSWIDAKKKLNINFPTYIQMFDEKHGFIENLSILDLIFMEGPNAAMYLENLNLNNAFS